MKTIDPAIPEKFLAAGLSVLPAKRERKCPAIGSWKTYQDRLPSQMEVETWFANAHDALCLVCGKVSGNLEIMDFDHKGELFPAWKAKVAPELFGRLVIEQTPSGGYHAAYRSASPICGSIKLAQGKREDDKVTTLIETRGEGGIFLCDPSDGYKLIQNDFTQIPAITDEEREDLLSAAYELNEHTPEMQSSTVPVGTSDDFAIRPGDDYNTRGDFRPLLLKYGWTPMHKAGQNEYFRRPGKQSGGQSASFNGEVFYVFSSNAAPFEPGAYSPFNAYTILEHNGDFSAAANALLEQGFGKTAEQPPVDISGLVPGKTKTEKKEVLFPDPGSFPEVLFEIPGFIGEYMKLSLGTAPYPNKILSLGGGLAFLSLMVGRIYKDRRGLHPNLYWISLADSGTGKEHARQVNKFLAFKAGMSEFIGDNFASGEGLEDAMYGTKKKLYMLDEMDTLFNSLKQKDSRAEIIMQRLLTFYSSANSFYTMRAKARKDNDTFGGSIVNPFLVLYGTALPKYFYGALEERVLENGLIPRTLIADAGTRGKYGEPKDFFLSPEMAEMLKVLKGKADEGGNLVVENPNLRYISETKEAGKMLDEDREYCDGRVAFFGEKKQMAAQVLWARSHEKVCKLAQLYAVSENVYDPKITATAVAWARALVTYLTKRMLFMADSYSYVDDFDQGCKKVLTVIRENGGMCLHSVLSRAMRRPADMLKKLIATLVERETIAEAVVTKTETIGRPGKYYKLL